MKKKKKEHEPVGCFFPLHRSTPTSQTVADFFFLHVFNVLHAKSLVKIKPWSLTFPSRVYFIRVTGTIQSEMTLCHDMNYVNKETRARNCSGALGPSEKKNLLD